MPKFLWIRHFLGGANNNMSESESAGNSLLNREFPHDTVRDVNLIRRAIKANWLVPEKRAMLQIKAFDLAIDLAEKETSKEFVAVAKLCEAMYQFDVKLAERNQIREQKEQANCGKNNNTPAVVITATPVQSTVMQLAAPAGDVVLNVDQRKQQLAERVQRLAAAGGDGSGSTVPRNTPG